MLEFIVYHEQENWRTVLILTNNRGKQVSTTINDFVVESSFRSYELLVRDAIQILIESWLTEYNEDVEWIENDEFLGFQYVDIIESDIE